MTRAPRRRTTRSAALVAALTALVLALGAFAVLGLVPTVTTASTEVRVPEDPSRQPVEVVRRERTLLEDAGWERVAFLLAPAAVCAAAVALTRTRSAQVARVVAAVALALYVVVTGLSVGLLYAPAGVAMAASAALGAGGDERGPP